MLESLLVLGGMAVVLIGAPGPAAMALAATGSSHHWRQGLPLIFGLVAGVLLTGLLTSAGMMALFSRWPETRQMMQVLGVVFILYMALRMLHQSHSKTVGSATQFGFRSGVLMNILNPKAYATFMVLISQFMTPIVSQVWSIVVLEVVSLLATLVVTSGWLLFGYLLGQMISSDRGKLMMRRVFSCLMIIFVLPIIIAMPGT